MLKFSQWLEDNRVNPELTIQNRSFEQPQVGDPSPHTFISQDVLGSLGGQIERLKSNISEIITKHSLKDWKPLETSFSHFYGIWNQCCKVNSPIYKEKGLGFVHPTAEYESKLKLNQPPASLSAFGPPGLRDYSSFVGRI